MRRFKHHLIIGVIFFSLTILSAGSLGWTAPENNQGGFEGVVTVLLVRHAEKGPTDHYNDLNTPLSFAGWVRAKKLAHVAFKAEVTAIYTTNFKRTKDTVNPLADLLKLESAIYTNVIGLVKKILSDHNGDVVLVGSHSGGFMGPTVPNIIEKLGAKDCNGFVDEYDNLFIVTHRPSDPNIPGDENKINVVNLQYGEPHDELDPQHSPGPDGVECTNQMTTLLLVRHAEPDNNSLSQAGRVRAEKLAHVALKAGVTAIYTTNTDRSIQTVEPLAEALDNFDKEHINSTLSSDEIEQFVDDLTNGGVYVVAAENHILSQIIEELGGSPIPSFSDDEYDNLFVVTVYEPGEPHAAKVVNLEYGEPSPYKNISVVQVIDRTGSMKTYGYIDPAKEKVQLFIDLMQPGEQVGVVSFATSCGSVVTSPTVDCPLQTILSEEREKEEAKNAVDGLIAKGCTPIGAGMQLGQKQLDGAAIKGYKPVMILLSDGYENRPPDVADVLPAIPDETDIYTIALGTTVDEILLQNIATTTGAEYYNSPTIEDLQKIYLQLHGAILGLDALEFTEGELGSGAEKEEDIDVDPLTKEATFVATWLNPDDNLTAKLYDANNNLVSASSTVKIYSDKTYRAYRVINPIPGNWRMKLIGTSITSAKADYVIAGFVDSELRLSLLPHEIKFLTGDRFLIAIKIETDGKPVLGANVKVDVNRPKFWAGNILAAPQVYGYVVSKTGLKSTGLTQTSPVDSLSPAAQRFFTIVSGSEKNLLARERFEIPLYDDGQHGDGKAADGVYANYLTKTELGGDHNFTVNTSCSVGGNATTRAKFFSAFNDININPDYSIVDVKLLDRTADGRRYNVTVVPQDQFGNYLGPGHPVSLTIACTDGSRQVTLDDNIDGTYTKEIFITQNEIKAGAKLEVDVDGKRFTTVEQLPTYGKWSVSIHSGATIPTGSFNNNYDPDYSIGLNFDYHFTPQFSAVGLLGYNHFNSGSPSVSDTYWWNISTNLKYEFTTSSLRPYANGGLGIYIPESGSTEPGFNAGLGLDYSLTSDWIIELGADYHHVFTSGSDIQFFVPHIGLIYRF